MQAANPPSREHIASFKGLLILLIVLGHNKFFYVHLRPAYDVIYSFHVFAFLALPFLLPSKPYEQGFLKDRAVRYYVPFLIFYGIACMAFYALFRNTDPITAFLWDVLAGAVVGSANALDTASGFKMFWFLPALFALIALKMLWDKAAASHRILLTLLFTCAYATAGIWPDWAKHHIPLGLPIALACILPCIAAGWGWQQLHQRLHTWQIALLSSALFILLATTQLHLNLIINLGDMELYAITSPIAFFTQFTLVLSGIWMMMAVVPLLARLPFVQALGNASLIIYLSHGLIFTGLTIMVAKLQGITTSQLWQSEHWLLWMLASFTLTLLLAWIVAFTIQNVPFFRRLVTPKNAQDWAPARALGRHSSH